MGNAAACFLCQFKPSDTTVFHFKRAPTVFLNGVVKRFHLFVFSIGVLCERNDLLEPLFEFDRILKLNIGRRATESPLIKKIDLARKQWRIHVRNSVVCASPAFHIRYLERYIVVLRANYIAYRLYTVFISVGVLYYKYYNNIYSVQSST